MVDRSGEPGWRSGLVLAASKDAGAELSRRNRCVSTRGGFRRLATLDWQVTGARLHDGEYHVNLSVTEPSTIPAFLVNRGLIHLVTVGGVSELGDVVVEFQPEDGTFGLLGSP